jgi:5-methylcytosine-specific restriction enzyme subunit McrC
MATLSATRNLLHLLSYTHDLRIHEQDVAPLMSQRSDWFELLTRLLAANLHRLMQCGLEHAYVVVEDTLSVIRGRWQLDRQLTQRPHMRHCFDVIYDEFSPDTPLNQIFRFVVEHLLLRTTDTSNRRLLGDVREWLADVQYPATVSTAHLRQINFTRLNERFRPAFNLARLFLESRVLQLEVGQHHTFAFMFDMNRLFEEFVAQFIIRHRGKVLPEVWSDADIRVQSQGKHEHLAERLPDRRPVFRLIPDVMLLLPSGRPVVIDTKYKQLDLEDRQAGVSQDDMYQMLAYMARLECLRTLILYPQPAATGAIRLEFEVQGRHGRLSIATINLRQPLSRPDALIAELRTVLEPLSALIF